MRPSSAIALAIIFATGFLAIAYHAVERERAWSSVATSCINRDGSFHTSWGQSPVCTLRENHGK